MLTIENNTQNQDPKHPFKFSPLSNKTQSKNTQFLFSNFLNILNFTHGMISCIFSSLHFLLKGKTPIILYYFTGEEEKGEEKVNIFLCQFYFC